MANIFLGTYYVPGTRSSYGSGLSHEVPLQPCEISLKGSVLSTSTDEATEALCKAPQGTEINGEGQRGRGSLLVHSGRVGPGRPQERPLFLRVKESEGEGRWGRWRRKQTDRDTEKLRICRCPGSSGRPVGRKKQRMVTVPNGFASRGEFCS